MPGEWSCQVGTGGWGTDVGKGLCCGKGGAGFEMGGRGGYCGDRMVI